MKISACMIVKNECENIQRCINSYKDIIDEIIVVDTGSTDNTVEMAEELGAKVLFMQWENDFAAPRNFAIDNASGDWIIFLDADEYFEEGGCRKLLNALKILEEEKKYKSMSCRMYHLDSGTGNTIGYNAVVRVFKRSTGIRYSNSIHEDLLDNGNTMSGMHFNDLVIYHTGYAASRVSEKHRRNIKILEGIVSKGKADAMTYYYMCNSYNGISDYEKTIHYADIAFEEEKNKGRLIPKFFRYKVYLLKIQSMGQLGDRYSNEEIGRLVDEARSDYPSHPEVLWVGAQYLMRIKRYRESLDCLLKAVESNSYDRKSGNSMCNYFDSYIDQAYSDIGFIYEYLNNEEAALDYSLKALEANRFNRTAALRLFRLIGSYKDEHIILLASKLYNTQETNDMKFLIECLCKVKLRIPLIYYTKIWNSAFKQEDISVLLSMLAMGRYGDVVKLGLITAKNSRERVGLDAALTAALIAGSKKLHKDEFIAVDPYAYQLLEQFEKKDGDILLDEHFINHLRSVLDILIPLFDNQLLVEFLEFILNHCSAEVSYLLFDRLLFYNKYDTAMEYYLKLLDKSDSGEIKGKCCFISGFCAYKLKMAGESAEMLEKALGYGNEDQEIYELLDIIS